MLLRPPISTLFPYTTLFRSALAVSGNGLNDSLNHGDDVLDVKGPVLLGLLKVLHRLQLVQDNVPFLLAQTDDVAELELLITGDENERVELLLDSGIEVIESRSEERRVGKECRSRWS